MCLALIRKMYVHADRGIAFNFLIDLPHLFRSIIVLFRSQGNVRLRHDAICPASLALDASYPLYECTVTVFNKDYMATVHGHDDLKKYFR